MEITKETVMENIDNPKMLEDLYRSNKKVFSETMKNPAASREVSSLERKFIVLAGVHTPIRRLLTSIHCTVTYNIMIVIVISVLIFTSINGINNKIINICSCILPVVTVILDIVTLSAVIYRLNRYGITANKITLLGTNLAMLGHLLFMVFLRCKHKKIERNIVYLPVYFIWSCCVVFVFPFVFKML